MSSRVVLSALLASALAAAPALAGEQMGPPFGSNRYVASIASWDGDPDCDDYVANLIAGEKVHVSIVAPKGSALRPAVSLVAPSGEVVEPAAPVLAANRSGTRVNVRAFEVSTTGRWAVRIAGRDGTEGDYTVAFRIEATPRVRAAKLVVTPAAEAVHTFEAVDGAILDARVTPRGRAASRLTTVLDPTDIRVPGLTIVTEGRRTSVSALPLHWGDGAYELHVATSEREATYDLQIRVTPQGRPSGRKAIQLAEVEPWLAPRAVPLDGVSGGVVTLVGANFSPTSPPAVWFGATRAPIQVSPDGTSIDATVPSAMDGSVVDVAVVAADGQACVRERYFRYAPMPQIQNLEDDRGIAVRLASPSGGETLHLRASGMEPGQIVRFGAAQAQTLGFVNAGDLLVVVPAGTPGAQVRISIEDRFGRAAESSFLFTYKAPPRLDPSPYVPALGPLSGGITVTVRGSGFESADRLYVGGVLTSFVFVSPTRVTFSSPGGEAGNRTVRFVDRYGAETLGPDFEVKAPPVIDAVTATGGACLDASTIAIGGGAVVEIQGENLRASDAVTIGGTPATGIERVGEMLRLVAPPGAEGWVGVTVTDAAGQGASLDDALRYAGMSDASAATLPAPSAVDNFAARRGALGDLDGDGDADDLVIITPNAISGSRAERTRVLCAEDGAMVDRTADAIPAAGQDDWAAAALALGDVDGDGATDIVIAGRPTPSTSGGDHVARVLLGSDGPFAFDPDSPQVRTNAVNVYNSSYWGGGASYSMFTPGGNNGADATALALGDLDGDGDQDLVIGTDMVHSGRVHVPLSMVDIQPGSYTMYYPGNYWNSYGTSYDAPALRIYDNRAAEGEGFVDVSFPRVPLGGSTPSFLPAFPARDLAVADLDDDGDLDIVVTWDDPTSVSGYGLGAGGGDSERVATRVLLNDGNGFFTDETDTWMPAGTRPEYWQAHRLVLADFDADGDPDLALVLAQSTGAYLGDSTHTARALRVLRNSGSAFASVSASALPDVPLAGTADDNLRGTALLAGDVDGDGHLDIVVGTTEALRAPGGGRARATRLLRGRGDLTFESSAAYVPPVSVDTGEADDLLLGDLAGTGAATLILVTETAPQTSEGGRRLRTFRWGE